jgi:hypothetical protein
MTRRSTPAALFGSLSLAAAACAALPAACQTLEARWSVNGEPLVIRSERRFAGAVSSLQFRGVEHLDSADHGRLLQGAISFNGRGECLNPTQAGASRDRRRSTSRLLASQVGPAEYRTTTRMAFWLRPGQSCTGRLGPEPAVNAERLSDVLYDQRLTPGWRGHANAVHHQITFTTATPRSSAVVEALTAYTPASFSVVLAFDRASGRLLPDREAQAHPGERDNLVALATPDGRHAIALFSPDPTARFGRFVFPDTSKINVVFRPPGPYPAGRHAYEAVTVVGTVSEVEVTLDALGK